MMSLSNPAGNKSALEVFINVVMGEFSDQRNF